MLRIQDVLVAGSVVSLPFGGRQWAAARQPTNRAEHAKQSECMHNNTILPRVFIFHPVDKPIKAPWKTETKHGGHLKMQRFRPAVEQFHHDRVVSAEDVLTDGQGALTQLFGFFALALERH